jgi:hypothetical protein
MTVIAVVIVPVVVAYQAWAYHIFRARLAVPKVGGEDGGAEATVSPTDAVAVTRSGGGVPPGPPAEAT